MKLIILMPLFLLASCSTRMSTKITPFRMLSPEAKGKPLGGQFSIGSAYSQETQILTDTDTDNIYYETNNDKRVTPVHITLGVSEQLDLYTQGAGQAGTTYGVKFQVWGKGKESASNGNVSVSIYTGAGSVTNSTKTDDAEEWVAIDEEVNMDYTQFTKETGILAGYRPSATTLGYLRLAKVEHDFWGKFSAKNDLIDGFRWDQKGTSTDIALGAIGYGAILSFHLELALQSLAFNGEETQQYGLVGFGVGFEW